MLNRPQLTTVNLLVLAGVLVILALLLQGNVGFTLADEGFLWYGTIRTALGEIPVRDFQSYEPGRYYWSALWFKLLRSDGIMALRVSQAVSQFVGLALALLLLRRVLKSWVPLIFAAIILVRWMFPTWKIYEPVILIAAIYFAVLIIEKPCRLRHLLAGIFIAVAAFFGRNHGLYCGVAFILLLFYLNWSSDKKVLLQRLGVLSVGVIIGYLPMLLMFALVPGFLNQFKADLLFNLNYGTNLRVPVPWPWRQTYAAVGAREVINRATVGMLYLVLPAFYVFALARLFFRRTSNLHPVFIASVFLGVVYLHYTFERPQLYYVVWTIPAFILGLIALSASAPSEHRKKLQVAAWSILALVTITALEMSQENYFTIKMKSFAKAKLMRAYGGDFDQAMNAQGLVKTDVRGDSLWVLRDTATMIDQMKAIDQNLVGPNEQILIAPYFPGLYAILQKRSPLWQIYFLLPRPRHEQEAMVQELESKQVTWALICSHYMDDRAELEFRQTHKLVWDYLVKNFEPIITSVGPQCELMKRRPTLSVLAWRRKFPLSRDTCTDLLLHQCW
jgi:hypothetical protein